MFCGDLNGKEVQKGGYIWVQLIHFAVQQKLIHIVKKNYTAIQLIFKKKYFLSYQVFSNLLWQQQKINAIHMKHTRFLRLGCKSYHTNYCSVAKSCLTLATLWIVAHQGPLSMGFPRQGYCNGFPFPSPKDLPDPKIKPRTLALVGGFLPLSHQESPPSLYF